MTHLDMEALFDELSSHTSPVHHAVAEALFAAQKEMLMSVMIMLIVRENTISELKGKLAAQEAHIADLTAKLGVK